MADIYLTRKERTTLYTEGFIYSIIIVLGAYFTIYGGLFVKMIPILFILGIIGRCIFDKPKTTLVLGTIAVILTGFVVEFKIDLNLILSAIYSSFLIALGLEVGKIVNMFYRSYKLRIFIGYNKKIMLVGYLMFLIVLAIFLNSIVNSNPIQYMIAKNKTEKYVKETYGDSIYKVESVIYNIENRGGYTFNLIIDGREVVLVHKTLSSIEDTTMEQRKVSSSKLINAEINRWKEENNIQKEINVYGEYSYSKVRLDPDILDISIEIASNDNSEIDEKILTVIDCVNKLRMFEEYSNINRLKLKIGEKSISIKREKMLEGVTKEYIQKGLEIEYLG